MFRTNIIDLNVIHSIVMFLELSISRCPGNSAYKMQVTGSGGGFLNMPQCVHFPDMGGIYDLHLSLVLSQNLICKIH